MTALRRCRRCDEREPYQASQAERHRFGLCPTCYGAGRDGMLIGGVVVGAAVTVLKLLGWM